MKDNWMNKEDRVLFNRPAKNTIGRFKEIAWYQNKRNKSWKNNTMTYSPFILLE
jgi:hypothetical protein